VFQIIAKKKKKKSHWEPYTAKWSDFYFKSFANSINEGVTMLNTEGTARAIEDAAKKRVCQWDL
jgi:hypothetical protein